MSENFNLNQGVKNTKKHFARLGNITANKYLNRKIVVPALILLAIPLTVGLSLVQQEMRSRASEQVANRVFVTSSVYNGNLGGLAGADAKCQARADAANLGGIWKAWLSDDNNSASSRLIHSGNQYKLLNGTLIANNWDDLTDGSIQAYINFTEQNWVRWDNPWTNTKSDGSINGTQSTSNTCVNWTSTGLIYREDTGSINTYGNTGNISLKDNGWTLGPNDYCGNIHPLYCFEQVENTSPTPTNEPTSEPSPTNEPTPTIELSPTPSMTPIPSPTPANLLLTLIPTADAFVRSSAPNANFGKNSSLETDSNPNEISYLKFNLSSLKDRTIKKATLRVKVSDATAQTLALRRGASVNWNETGITYNNRPGFEGVISSFNAKTLNTYINLNVTGFVNNRKGGNVTFGITSGGDETGSFYSRESSSNRPQLIVEYQ